MGTIIDPTAIRAQSDGIVRALTAQNSALRNVLPSISNFQNEPELGGAAWSGLKSHIGGHRSVIQGLICANEDVMSDSEELITASGSEKLDEDKIRAEIEKLRSQSQRYYSNYIHYSDLLRQPAIAVMPTLMPYYRRMMWHYMSLRTKSNQAIIKLEKKLAKIAKIMSATSSLYTTSEALYGNVETGLQQLGTSGSSGGFTGVAGGTWQTNIDKRWKQREESIAAEETWSSLSVDSLTDDQKSELLNLISLETTEDGVLETVREFLQNLNDKGYIGGALEDFGTTGLEELLTNDAFVSKLASKFAALFGPSFPTTLKGLAGINQNGVQSLLAQTTQYSAQSMLSSAGNAMSNTFSGTLIGTAVGTSLNLASGDSPGQAVAEAGVTTVISSVMIGAVGLVVGSNPVGWAAVGIAVLAGAATTYIYENNWVNIKTRTEVAGEWLDDYVFTPAGEAISNVGNTISNTWNSLWSW